MNTALNRNRIPFALLACLFIVTCGFAVITEKYFLLAIPFVFLLILTGWQNKALLFFLLIATLPLSAEYQFSSGLGTDFPDEGLMILVAFLFIVYVLYRPAVIRQSLQHPLLWIFGIYCCWMLVTVIFSTHPLVSVKYILAKSWYAGAFILAPLVLFRDKKNMVITAKTLLLSLLVITVIILFRHSQSGFRFATVNEVVQPFFRNHVNYSAMLVCCIPVLAAAYVLTSHKNIRRSLLVAGLIFVTALFFSYARGAWLAALAGVMAYALLRIKWLVPAFLLTVTVAVISLFWLKSNDRYLQFAHQYQTTIFHRDFSQHLVSTYRLKDLSTAERFYRWIAGVRMIKDNPVTGYGPNTFYENYKPYAVPAYKTWVSDNPERSTVHNYFLLLAIEQGIPGLFFFGVLLTAMLWYAQGLYQQVADPFYKTAAAVVAVMLCMMIVLNFLSDLIETDKLGSLFYLCFGILVVTDIQSRQRSDSSPYVEGIP